MSNNKNNKKNKRFQLKKIFEPNIKSGSWHAKHPRLVKFFYIIFFPIINPYLRYVTLFFFSLAIIGIFLLLQHLPSPQNLTGTKSYAVSTQIFDRNGELLYEIYADENRIPIRLEDLPDHVIQATIAIEDKNFYRHAGIDLRGVLRAAWNNLFKQTREGGSTITQQLVKNALLTPEQSFTRKFNEAILAIMTEIVYSKDEILEMYLNYISYGGTSLGIEAAAQAYFDKSAHDLNLAEAALLSGLPKAPTRYSPFGSNPEQAQQRQAEVLRRMMEDNYISSAEAEEAHSKPLDYALSQTEIKAPHFAFYVRDWLYEKYGIEKVQAGGLRVHTTLDLQLQREAQKMVSEEVEGLIRYQASNGAALITKPNTGEILAMIGSKDYFNIEEEGQVNLTLASRQPGSAIKPLMYATTFQKKTLNPGTIMLDVPTCFLRNSQPAYCPRNYDGGFRGMTTVRQSLGSSFNIPAVKAQATIGAKLFIEQASKMGITTWKDPADYGLSLTLGGGEVKMLDMAQSFGSLANQGILVPLNPILKIEDYRGNILEELDLEQRISDLDYLNNYESDYQRGGLERVMDRAPAYLTNHILQDNQARAAIFGTNSQLVIPNHIVSAKTGTTNNLRDNWTIGYTPEFLVVTWVGNNDNTPMNYLASGIVGAAPMFNDLMTHILQDTESIWQEKPSDVQSGGICAHGMPPEYSSESCQILRTDLFWTKSKPSAASIKEEAIWIDPATGFPPEDEEAEGLEAHTKTLVQDPVSTRYCLDCQGYDEEKDRPIYNKQNIKIVDGKAVVAD